MNSLPPPLLNIFYQYTESHAGDSDFVDFNVDQRVPESARRYAAYISSLLHDRIKLSANSNEVTLDHFLELLNWPALGMILRKFLWSEQLQSLLSDQPPISARYRLQLVGSLIDFLTEKLITGNITYGEFAKLLTRQEKFEQLLNHLATEDATTAVDKRDKRERYLQATPAIVLRKKQRDCYQQQRKRLEIFVDRFKNLNEIGTY